MGNDLELGSLDSEEASAQARAPAVSAELRGRHVHCGVGPDPGGERRKRGPSWALDLKRGCTSKWKQLCRAALHCKGQFLPAASRPQLPDLSDQPRPLRARPAPWSAFAREVLEQRLQPALQASPGLKDRTLCSGPTGPVTSRQLLAAKLSSPAISSFLGDGRGMGDRLSGTLARVVRKLRFHAEPAAQQRESQQTAVPTTHHAGEEASEDSSPR